MSKVDELVINYAIYEDAVEYLGTTEVTLPDLEYMTEELSGAMQCQQLSISELSQRQQSS